MPQGVDHGGLVQGPLLTLGGVNVTLDPNTRVSGGIGVGAGGGGGDGGVGGNGTGTGGQWRTKWHSSRRCWRYWRSKWHSSRRCWR